MKAYARPIILVLAALGLAASLSSLYVHYQLLHDPSYASPCDIRETVSCQAVLESSYSSVAGVPVAAGGAIWAALVLLLAALGLGSPDRDRAEAAAGYTFVLSVLGLATVFYLGYASFVVIGKLCVLCLTMYVAVIGVFLASSSAASQSIATLPGRLFRDMRAVFTRPIAATLAILWLVGSVSLIAFFREEGQQQASPATTAAVTVPTEALDQEQINEWHAWLDRQPRISEMAPTGSTKVLFVKFNDYQCPSCRATWAAYKDIIAKYEEKYPGVFKYETRDYPLEPECGMGGVHGNACEAGAAVRLAREHNKGREMETWLFEHQEQQSRDTIKSALKDIAGVGSDEYEAKYKDTLAKLHEDALLGNKLGVTGTPTFYLNGIKMPSVRAAHLDAAIAHELQKAGVS
jgi:uncharacterized membrane protein/protein-disulfide isomerase